MTPIFLACVLVLNARAAAASDAPTLAGRFPYETFPDGAAAIADIWRFVKALGAAPEDLTPPLLYFSKFDPVRQEAAWTRWQADWARGHDQVFIDWLCVSGQSKYPEPRDGGLCGDPAKVQAWLALHPGVLEEYPFPPDFRALQYEGTNRIQIDSRTTFLRYVGLDPESGFGGRKDWVGLGYYVTGHEMLHYVLDARGVSAARHHCLFVTPELGGRAPMDRLAEFLIERGYASDLLVLYGLQPELDMKPCGGGSP